jgi:hypothetical protein
MDSIKATKNPKTPKGVLNFSKFPKFSNLWISKLCKIMTATSYELELCDSQKKTIPNWFTWCFSHIFSFFLVFYLLFLHVYYVFFSCLWYKGGEKVISRVILHMVLFLYLDLPLLALTLLWGFGFSIHESFWILFYLLTPLLHHPIKMKIFNCLSLWKQKLL